MKKILTMLLAITLILGLAAPALAATNYDYGKQKVGTTTELTKYLVVDADANIPAATFEFTVSAGGTAATATASTVTVFAGPSPELVKVNGVAEVGTVTFAAGETATNALAQEAEGSSSTRIAAKKTIELDFSAIEFEKPGVYRYTITETDPVAPFYAIGEKTTTVDVYIQDVNGALELQGYVAYDGTVTAAPKNATDPNATAPNNGAEAGTKDAKFVNECKTFDLKVDKVVAGNQGDKEETFEVVVVIENAGNGTKINAGAADTGKSEPDGVTPPPAASFTQYPCDASGKVTITVILGHNDQLVLTGIPENATYTVKETLSGQNGYVTTGEVATATTLAADASETITNTRTGVIPTGILLPISGGVALVAIAGAALIALNRKKRDDE